jgi:hypothetical protein
VKRWRISERARLKTELMALGYGRWEDLRKSAQLDRWTPIDVRQFSRALLRQLAKYAEESVEESALNDLENSIDNTASAEAPMSDDTDEQPAKPDGEPNAAATNNDSNTDAGDKSKVKQEAATTDSAATTSNAAESSTTTTTTTTNTADAAATAQPIKTEAASNGNVDNKAVKQEGEQKPKNDNDNEAGNDDDEEEDPNQPKNMRSVDKGVNLRLYYNDQTLKEDRFCGHLEKVCCYY